MKVYFQAAFGVNTGNTIRTEFGAYIKAIFIKDLTKDFNVQTTFDFFSNYLSRRQKIDVNWQVLLAYKLTKFISATLTTQLIYDDNTKLTFYKSDGVTVDQ